MTNLYKLFLFYFLLSISIFALPVKYAPVVMGDITSFIPLTQIKINLSPYVVVTDGEDTVVKTNINFPKEVVSYEWREGNRLLSTKDTLSTEILAQGDHIVVLTITDKNGLTTNDEIVIVKVGYAYLAKFYMTQNIFEMGPAFNIDKDFTPLSSPEYKSIVAFSLDNEMLAVIDCSLFTADYIVEDYGIFFSNISREVSDDLKCLYSDVEDNFEKVLNKGIYFNNAVYDDNLQISNYDPRFKLFPNFDVLSKVKDFNFTKFEEKLYKSEYVDSPLMNSVLNIQNAFEYKHVGIDKYFSFMTFPQIHIEDKRIYINLLDASFEADIIVVDATHIKFANVTRVNKENVTYPTDIECDSNAESENECLEDPYTDNYFSEKFFADIVETFLHEIIDVSLYSTDYTFVQLKGSQLEFITK